MRSNLDGLKLFLLMLVAAFPAFAQAQRSDESIRVKVHKSQEGHVLQIEEDVPAADAQNLEQLMKKYGMTDELQELKPGEEVEIVIRRKQGGEDVNDVTIEMDRKPTPPITAKPTPPMILEPKKAFLGVHYEMNYGATIGSHVTKVEPGTPAAKAGLMAGDVITKADNVSLFVLNDLSDVISTKKAGEKVRLTYVREGKINTTYVTLAVRDEAFFRNNPGGGPSYQLDEEYDLSPSSIWIDENAVKKPNSELGGPLLGVLMLRSDQKTIVNGVETVARTDGAIVDEVIGSSAATEIGLHKGDKILVLNGRHIKTSTDVTSFVAAMKVGDRVDVEYLHEGQRKVGSGTLKARKDFDLPSDVELNGISNLAANEETLDRLQRMIDAARARNNAPATVREFRMVISMDELTAAEAQLLSARSGQPIKAVSDLDLRNLTVSPNPSTGKFSLGFELPAKGTAMIDVLDMNGAVVYAEQLNDFQGRYSKNFDLSQEVKGIYVMRIVQNGKAFTRKILTQ